MKLRLHFSLLVFIFGNTLSILNAQILGGQMSASLISNNKIVVHGAMYRDCRGVSIVHKNLIYKCFVGSAGGNSCGTVSLTVPTFKVKDANYLYKGQKLPCSPSNTYGTGTGLELHYFDDTIDMSTTGIKSLLTGSSCSEITFSLQSCCRHNIYTNGAQGTIFTVTATIHYLNLLKCPKKTNHAPLFAFVPKMRITDREIHAFTPAPYDKVDNDKINCQMGVSLSDIPNKTITLSSPFKANAPIPTYCMPSGNGFCNAMPSLTPPRGFYFDTTTGLMIFQPNIDNIYSINSRSNAVIHFYEYRLDSAKKWILIGRSMREFDLIHDNIGGGNNPPVINSNKDMLAIAGKPFYYEFKVSDLIKLPNQSKADTVKVEVVSGHSAFSIYIKNPNDREKTVVISGTPDTSMISKVPYRMSVLANDQFGLNLAISSRQILIHVKPAGEYVAKTKIGNCNKVHLSAEIDKKITGSTGYSWTIIDSASGKLQFSSSRSNDSSMSLSNGKKYIKLFIVNENYGFNTFYDTITLKNAPTFKIIGDTAVCKGNILDLKAAPINMKTIKKVEYISGVNYGYLDTINRFNVFKVDSNMVFLATATDSIGCRASLNFKIKVSSMPPKQLTDPVFLCQNGPDADLVSYCKLSNTDTIKFWAPNGIVYDEKYFATKNIFNGEFNGKTAVYKKIYYSLKDTNKCILIDSTEIIVYKLPFVSLLQNDLCQNKTYIDLNQLVMYPSRLELQTNYYKWKVISTPTGAKGKVILTQRNDSIEHFFQFGNKSDQNFAGQYKFQFYYLDSNSMCAKYDTLKLVVYNEPKITFDIESRYCANQKNIDLLGLVYNDDNPAGFGSFELLSHNNSNTSGLFFGTRLIANRYFPKTAVEGIWKFSYFDPLAKCRDTGYAQLKIVPTPEAEFRTKDTLIDEFSPSIQVYNNSTISDNSNMDHLWDPGTSKPADMNTSFHFDFTYPSTPATYKLKLISSSVDYGCSDTFQKNIVVQKNLNTKQLFSKNIQLNQSGILSGFEGQFIEGRWYNEAGQLILTDKQNLGLILKPGIYFYEISINHKGSSKVITGKMLQP